MAAFGWKVVYDGRTSPLGAAVGPDERLSWPRTVGLGAQHVMAMFGATFVFPIIMGLNANLAILMSGIATICFLLIVGGQVPSYLGTSASFVGASKGGVSGAGNEVVISEPPERRGCRPDGQRYRICSAVKHVALQIP